MGYCAFYLTPSLCYIFSAIIRCCCPCCLRGEPEEKRVRVAYDNANPSKPEAEENVALLKPVEQPQDEVNENGDTVKENIAETSDQNPNDNEEDEGGDMDGDVIEYTDEKGSKVRRVVNETVTTTVTRTGSGDDESPKNLTREVLEKTVEKPEPDVDENTEVMEYVDKNGRRVRRIVKKKIITTISTKSGTIETGSNGVTTQTTEITSGGNGAEKQTTTFQPKGKPRAVQEKEVFLHFDTKPPSKEERRVDVQIKGLAFPVENRGYTTITSESSGGNKDGDSYSSVYKRTVVTKTIGGGDNRSVVEHSTTSFGRDGEHPIMVVKKDGRQIDVPDWMEERKSPASQRKQVENSDISIHLKYPGDYAPEKKQPEGKANESKIRPEVDKRDKPDISILSLEDAVKEREKEKEEVRSAPTQPTSAGNEGDDEDENEDDEDDEDDGEYDEFEEEILVMEVHRKPRYPRGLEIPKPESEKVGVPIEDLLEVPTLQMEQESSPVDELLIEEKIEPAERPLVAYSELPVLNFLVEQ